MKIFTFTGIFFVSFFLITSCLVDTDKEEDKPAENTVDTGGTNETTSNTGCITDSSYNQKFMTDFYNAYNKASKAQSAGTINGYLGGNITISSEQNLLSQPYFSAVYYTFNNYNDTGTVYNGTLTLYIHKHGYVCEPCGATDGTCSYCTTFKGTINATGTYGSKIEFNQYGLNTQLAESGYYIVNCQTVYPSTDSFFD